MRRATPLAVLIPLTLALVAISLADAQQGAVALSCAPGQVVMISGQGAPQRAALLLLFGGRTVGGGLSDASGSFAIPVTVGQERPGSYEIRVETREARALIAERTCIVPGANVTPAPGGTAPGSTATGGTATGGTATPKTTQIPPAPAPTQTTLPLIAPLPITTDCGTISSTNTPERPIRIAALDKEAEAVTLENVGDADMSLDGWRICSVRAGQEHIGVSGTIAPGERRDFTNSSGRLIWNNEERDDAALFDPDGHLISYYVDAP